MKIPLVSAALLLAAPLVPSRGETAASLPLSDNTAPPYLGVWTSPDDADQFAGWLHRSLIWADVTLAYHDVHDWQEIEAMSWVDAKWNAWVAARPGRRLVVGLPMFTGPGASLAEGATGAYNAHFTALATTLVARGFGHSILRLGWDFNGGPAWRVGSAADAANYVLLWRQIVKTIRAVPGAEKIEFAWQGLNFKTAYKLEDAYPGDAYVDYVGMETMDSSFDAGTYPYPPAATDEQRLACQQAAWRITIYPAAHNGLEAWLAVARAHHKPFCIPQWGLNADHHNGCGFDNPYFIRQMHNFIQDPANNVAFATYFNYYHACKISPTGPDGTLYPQASTVFHQLFALSAPAAP